MLSTPFPNLSRPLAIRHPRLPLLYRDRSPDSRERKSRRASSLFFSLPLSPFFFRFALTRSKLMIAASLAAIPGRERDFLFSPLFAARCHFSRVPRFTMEDGRTEQSRTIPFPFEYNGVF